MGMVIKKMRLSLYLELELRSSVQDLAKISINTHLKQLPTTTTTMTTTTTYTLGKHPRFYHHTSFGALRLYFFDLTTSPPYHHLTTTLPPPYHHHRTLDFTTSRTPPTNPTNQSWLSHLHRLFCIRLYRICQIFRSRTTPHRKLAKATDCAISRISYAAQAGEPQIWTVLPYCRISRLCCAMLCFIVCCELSRGCLPSYTPFYAFHQSGSGDLAHHTLDRLSNRTLGLSVV